MIRLGDSFGESRTRSKTTRTWCRHSVTDARHFSRHSSQLTISRNVHSRQLFNDVSARYTYGAHFWHPRWRFGRESHLRRAEVARYGTVLEYVRRVAIHPVTDWARAHWLRYSTYLNPCATSLDTLDSVRRLLTFGATNDISPQSSYETYFCRRTPGDDNSPWRLLRWERLENVKRGNSDLVSPQRNGPATFWLAFPTDNFPRHLLTAVI